MAEVDVEVKWHAPRSPARSVPTFSPIRRRALSPLLAEYYRHVGVVTVDSQRILTPAGMARPIRSRAVLGYHRALRENWEDSAPQHHKDSDLGLLSYTPELIDHLTYLVWTKFSREPEVWHYSGMQEDRFDDLRHYLRWLAGEQESRP